MSPNKNKRPRRLAGGSPHFSLDRTRSMQFIPHGPDIPNDMLQAHEEGRLVFFCGAGISMPAGLPDFRRLVTEICGRIGTHLRGLEKNAFDDKHYDRALMLLERRLPGGAEEMRKAMWDCLQPPLSDHLDLKTHAALLTLAHDRSGMLHLITTNFDRLFIQAASGVGQDIDHLAAPQLPVPRSDRWNGIVYLHGLLPERRDDSTTLKNLVVTSGDFGLAYLHDRWAARFVSEMLRTYNICFVGYSLGDAILRYMVDALAALRLETGTEGMNCWALAENGATSREQWEAKGVKPILYKEGSHDLLHRTLHAWAAHYRDGLQAKAAIISRNAPLPPDTGTEEDDFVGRVLWALADPSGAPAEQFARLDPAPPLEWLLEAFYRKNSPLAPILSDSAPAGRKIMRKLFPWVVKHAHDPRLLLWILRQEEQQQVRWRELFRGIRLDDIGKEADLAEADKAYLRKLFALFRNGWIIGRNMTLTDLPPEEEAQRLSACLSLRQALVPHLVLRKGIQEQIENVSAPRTITHFWPEILLADDASLLFEPDFLEKWRIILPDLAEPVQQHLLDALNMLEELAPQTVNARRDLSFFCFPSISQHKQNRDRSARALLMLLLREAWKSLHRQNSTAAISMAESWFGKSYPTFKRFALYAAAQDDVIAPARWVALLRQDNGYWLWSSETRREVCRLLIRQGHSLDAALREQLEEAILAGPPRDIFREDMSEEEYQGHKQYLSWLLLKKLSRNSSLSSHARSRLEQMEQEDPRLRREPDEQEEFPVWVGSPQDVPSSPVAISALPRTCDEIVRWITEGNLRFSPKEQQWRQLCRERGRDCLQALQHLSRENIFPPEFWWDAVQIWTEAISETAFHQELLDWLLQLSENALLQLAESCSWWLVRCAEGNLLAGSASFIELCHKLLFLSYLEDSSRLSNTSDIVNQALNSPQGNAARALLHLWSNSGLRDNAGLVEPYRTLLTELCDRHEPLPIHAHVFLGRYAITLYRVDRGWTEEHLLPLFTWQQNEWDASALWSGFLWTARFYPDLFMEFWSSFVACSGHYAELGAGGRQYVQLATLIAIERMDNFPAEDFRTIFSTLPVEALPASLHWLEDSIEQLEEDHRATYISDRIIPFFHAIWPKDRRCMTPEISEGLASLCLASPLAFSAIWKVCRHSIGPVSRLLSILFRLQQSGICRSSPRDALDFLEKVYGKGEFFSHQLLGKCLAELAEAEPELRNTETFHKLYSF